MGEFNLRTPVLIVPNATFTGIITVSTAGSPVTGPAVANPSGFILKGHTANTNVVWVFAKGQTKASGFPLAKGESVYVPVSALDSLAFDAEVNNEKICFIRSTV